MKIVIDIPEKYLNDNIIDVTLFTGANNTITDVNVEDKHTKFQVLPKGHGDLIDRSKLTLSNFECVMCNGDFKEGLKMYIDKVDQADAVVPAETVEVN